MDLECCQGTAEILLQPSREAKGEESPDSRGGNKEHQDGSETRGDGRETGGDACGRMLVGWRRGQQHHVLIGFFLKPLLRDIFVMASLG